MGPKLFLKTSQPPTPANETAPIQTPGGTLKLKLPAPPTPAAEQQHSAISFASSAARGGAQRRPSAKKDPARNGGKASKKRAATNDAISPAAKRVASDASRRASIILKASKSAVGPNGTPTSAGPKLKLHRSSTGPKLRGLHVKGRVPERLPGNAYDSEDSEREADPATEQHLVLRMQPGEDCDYLRTAIAERTIGIPPQDGGAEVTLKFVDRELRRAVVTVRKNMYAAALVDLPCIVETMKSWDKRGWWKVADVSQMLLVLGRVSSEDEAKHFALPPRIVNEKTMQYAHGLTPPMHWVRKRRFRKRLSYRDTANVEEEVQKLLDEDDRAEREGGSAIYDITTRDSLERSEEPESYPFDYEDGAVDTIEDDAEYEDEQMEEMEEMDVDAAEADLQAMFDRENEAAAGQNISSDFVVTSPDAVPDQTASLVAIDTADDSTLATPTGTAAVAVELPAESADDLFGDREESSGDEEEEEDEEEEDDDDDEDIDTFDEDAQARAAERNLQKQEIQDLENEIELQRQKLEATKNQLLLQRQRDKLKSLEDDLGMKRRVYGYADDEDED